MSTQSNNRVWDLFAREFGLAEVFEQAPVGMAVLDGSELRYSLANPRYRQIIGNRDPVGRRLVEMFPELAGTPIETIIRNVHETGTPFAANDLLIRFDSQGTGMIDNYYDLVYHPLVTSSHKAHGVLVVAVDVTERHHLASRERVHVMTEAARGEAVAGLEQLAAVFRDAPSFLAVFRGPDHVFELANSAYYRLIGPDRRIIGRALLDALPEVAGQGFDVILDTVVRTGETIIIPEIPVRLARKLGDALEDRVVSLTYLPLVAPTGERVGVIAHGIDVTDFVNARTALERAADERSRLLSDAELARADADEANRAKSRFLAVISHELRTPLNAIGGYSALIEMGIRGPVTDEQRQDLGRVQHAQRHMLTLIDSVLTFAKISAGAEPIAVEDVSMNNVLDDCEALTAPQVQSKGLSFERVRSADSPIARGDREKVQMVVLNLLSNAIKFTDPTGRVVLSCVRRSDDRVVVTVTDTGRGIPREQQERIFAAFVQLDPSLSRDHHGTGLGLAISRDLARAMAGDLTVESVPGVGSTFTLTLPAAP